MQITNGKTQNKLFGFKVSFIFLHQIPSNVAADWKAQSLFSYCTSCVYWCRSAAGREKKKSNHYLDERPGDASVQKVNWLRWWGGEQVSGKPANSITNALLMALTWALKAFSQYLVCVCVCDLKRTDGFEWFLAWICLPEKKKKWWNGRKHRTVVLIRADSCSRGRARSAVSVLSWFFLFLFFLLRDVLMWRAEEGREGREGKSAIACALQGVIFLLWIGGK